MARCQADYPEIRRTHTDFGSIHLDLCCLEDGCGVCSGWRHVGRSGSVCSLSQVWVVRQIAGKLFLRLARQLTGFLGSMAGKEQRRLPWLPFLPIPLL